MKRTTNIYPVYVFGREIYVSFDHFTNAGQAGYISTRWQLLPP